MITKEQAIEKKEPGDFYKYSYFTHISEKLSDKVTPLRVRRNGKTVTWKSKKNLHKFKIPVKMGLYAFGYITEENANEWEAKSNLR